MASKRKLTIEIFGDAKDASRAFNQVESAGGKMARGLGTVGKTAALAVGGIAIAGVGAAAILGPKVLEMGASLETIGIKSATVFEGSQKDVQEWAEANARAMGLTAKEAEGMAANMGDLLKPMGFTAEQAAGMSIEMNNLAGALSAWSGGARSSAEVSEILSKALLGERDSLKSLGISITEAEVTARLMKKGQNELTGAALQQAKALATQELILEKSTDAQKAWTDGSMDGIKAQMSSEAAIKQLKETVVQGLYPALQQLLPVIESVATWMADNLPGAMEKVKTWVNENWPPIRDVIIEVFTKIHDWVSENWPEIQAVIQQTVDKIREGIVGFVDFVSEIWEQWGDEILGVVQTIFPPLIEVVRSAVEIVRGIIKTVTSIIKGDWGEAWNGIKQILSGALDAIVDILKLGFAVFKETLKLGWEAGVKIVKDVVSGLKTWISNMFTETIPNLVKRGVDAVIDWISGLPGRVISAVTGAFDSIWDQFRGVVNKIVDGWNGLEFKLPSVNTHIPGVGTIGGFTIGTPNIPRLHQGGVVGGMSFAGLRPDEIPVILQRGEIVLTKEQQAAAAPMRYTGPMVLVIEGQPFRAMLQRHDQEVMSEMLAGVR